MKKIPNWIIILVVIGLLVGSKFIFFNKSKDKGQAVNKNKGGMPVAVNYFVVRQTQFSNDVFATGKVGAFNQIEILPEVSGKVTAIYFKEGETVNKGSLLIKLNDADLQAQLLKSTTQLKLSEQKFGRLKKLIEIKGISQEEYDMQENEIMGLKADQAFINASIAKTNIVAPFSGVIGLRNVSEGSFVGPTIPVASLVQLKPLYVEFSIPEKYSGLFRQGINVSFSSDNASGSKTYSANIYAIEPRVDEVTKTIRARALYSGNQTFYPGTFVKVYVSLGDTKNALMVPTQAVIPTLKGQKVIVCRNGSATDAMVTIGVRTDTRIQVLDGIQEGDTIITTGLLSVKSGSKLKLLKPVK
ncbi:MAG: efflux RND transporter periplasmic adaptor subunit [Bacteroidota bacterium]